MINTLILHLPLLFFLLFSTLCGWLVVRWLRYRTWLGALVGGELIPIGEIILPATWSGIRITLKVFVSRRPSGEAILLEWNWLATMKRRFQYLMLMPAEATLQRAYLSALANAPDLPPEGEVSLVLYNAGFGRLRMNLNPTALKELVAILDRALARREAQQSEVAP